MYAPDYGHGDPEPVPGARVTLLKPAVRYGNAAWISNLGTKLAFFDTVILMYPFFGSMRQVYLGRKKGKYRLVLVYNMDVVGSGLKGLIFAYATKYFLPKILRASDVVHASSEDYAQHSKLSTFWKKGSGCEVLPLGVDVQRFSPGSVPDSLYEILRIPRDKKIVLFVGGLDPAHYFKGVHHLITSARHLDSMSTHVVIAGRGSLIEHYQKQSSDEQVADRITFTGGVTDDQLVSLYRAASVTVLPSVDQSESFGIVLVESMACGTPVVTSDLPGVRAVYEHDVSGICVPVGDVEKLAEAIQRITTNESLRQAMSEAARTRALEKYDWEKIGDALLTKM